MTRNEFIDAVKTVQPALRRLLLALCCGDSALADDLAQESLMKAYLHLDSLRDHAAFRPWVTGIAYRVFIDSRRAQAPVSPLDTAHAVPAETPADYQDLYAALSMLVPAERSVLLLFYIEGYSTREIASLTGASEPAVRQQLSRGRQHLKNRLNQLS